MLHVIDEGTGSQRGERTFPYVLSWGDRHLGGIKPRGTGYLEATSRQLASRTLLRTKRWSLYIDVSVGIRQKCETWDLNLGQRQQSHCSHKHTLLLS